MVTKRVRLERVGADGRRSSLETLAMPRTFRRAAFGGWSATRSTGRNGSIGKRAWPRRRRCGSRKNQRRAHALNMAHSWMNW